MLDFCPAAVQVALLVVDARAQAAHEHRRWVSTQSEICLAQLTEQRIDDLVKLYRYKMLGRAHRTGRNPSAFLSARLARSDTMRCALACV